MSRPGVFEIEGRGAAKAAAAAAEQGGAEIRPGRGASPFGETADPSEYVPRDSTEKVLGELAGLVARAQLAALTAGPGLGKTLLLHVLAMRLRDQLRSLYLPYGAMALDELCAWALGRLDQPVVDDPVGMLLGCARAEAREGASALVLLLDDVSSVPDDTARALVGLVRGSEQTLRLVVAASDDASSSRKLATLGVGVVELRLTTPMSHLETCAYVRTRLRRAGVPDAVRARFDAVALDRIYSLSGGVPRRVNEVAASLAADLPAGVHPGWREQRWLGAPLDELSGADVVPGDLDGGELLELSEVLSGEKAE